MIDLIGVPLVSRKATPHFVKPQQFWSMRAAQTVAAISLGDGIAPHGLTFVPANGVVRRRLECEAGL